MRKERKRGYLQITICKKKLVFFHGGPRRPFPWVAGRWQQNKREDEVVSYKLGSVSQVQDPSSQQHLLDYIRCTLCAGQCSTCLGNPSGRGQDKQLSPILWAMKSNSGS